MLTALPKNRVVQWPVGHSVNGRHGQQVDGGVRWGGDGEMRIVIEVQLQIREAGKEQERSRFSVEHDDRRKRISDSRMKIRWAKNLLVVS